VTRPRSRCWLSGSFRGRPPLHGLTERAASQTAHRAQTSGVILDREDCPFVHCRRQPKAAHRASFVGLDRRRERARAACPVQGLKQACPSRRWEVPRAATGRCPALRALSMGIGNGASGSRLLSNCLERGGIDG